MKDSSKIILAIVISVAVLALLYMIGNAVNTVAERNFKLQTACQQNSGYWDNYRKVCGGGKAP